MLKLECEYCNQHSLFVPGIVRYIDLLIWYNWRFGIWLHFFLLFFISLTFLFTSCYECDRIVSYSDSWIRLSVKLMLYGSTQLDERRMRFFNLRPHSQKNWLYKKHEMQNTITFEILRGEYARVLMFWNITLPSLVKFVSEQHIASIFRINK
jgi:hypothetical protein